MADPIDDLIASIIGGDAVNFAPTPSGSILPTSKSYNPLGLLPKITVATTRAQAEQARREALATLQIWQDYNSAAQLEWEAAGGGAKKEKGTNPYVKGGVDGLDYMGPDGPMDDVNAWVKAKNAWEEQNKGTSSSENKPLWLRQTEQAVADLSTYITNTDAIVRDLPKTQAPKETGPVKLTAAQFLSALGGQESSSFIPTWSNAKMTNDFGPTDEVRDSGYTDENGNTYDHFNKGYDFGVPVNTPVETPVAGTVIQSGWAKDGWGFSVKIRDAEGNIHNFGHMNGSELKPGDTVTAGQLVGVSGDTADPLPDGTTTSSAPHLSYDVKNAKGYFIDPGKFISGNTGAVNESSGAYGAFQIMPGYWADYVRMAGLPAGTPMTPENQKPVALGAVQSLYDKYGDWGKVAVAWYAGEGAINWTEEQLKAPQKNGPSAWDYRNAVLGRAGNLAKGLVEGTSTPGGYNITGTPSSGSGSGGGASTDPLYWQKAAAGESDRRYDNWSQRAKDYLAVTTDENVMLKDLASILGNKTAAMKTNQDIQDSAIKTATAVNAAVKEGKADYYDSMGGGIWGNSLGGIIKELDKIYNEMNRPVPGMSETMLSTIPRYTPEDYYMDIPGVAPAPTEFFTPNRYATGTVDWHDEPYIAIAQSGGNIPTAVRKRLEAAGALGPSATPTTPTTTGAAPVATPAVTGGYPGAGYVPRNSTLPTPERVYDTNEWLDQAVSAMARNISAGNSGLPAEWGVTGLEAWHGVPPSQMDASFLTRLRSIILAHKSDPAIVQAFGADPGVATEYVRDPNAPAVPKNTGNGGIMNGYGSSQTMSGTYGGGMDPADAARIGLEKESLELQREIQRAQIALEREKFLHSKDQDVLSEAWRVKEYELRQAESALNAQRFELEKTNAELQKTIFEDNVRRWEIETGMSRERLDLDKIAQEAELDFKRRQLDIQRDAGILDQKKYDESVRQFNETFGYQKSQDDRKFRLERAKTVAEFMADPNDPMARNFFYANMEDPKGIAFDMFTGENMGESTYGETYKKNAEMWEESTQPVNQFSSGSMYSHGSPYVRDSLFITGDHVSGRATGNEEAIYNPTGAPVAIFSNEMTRALGLAPKKGKNFRGAA